MTQVQKETLKVPVNPFRIGANCSCCHDAVAFQVFRAFIPATNAIVLHSLRVKGMSGTALLLCVSRPRNTILLKELEVQTLQQSSSDTRAFSERFHKN